MPSPFVKRQPGAPRGLFRWEALGLEWLGRATADGGARVVPVLDVDEERIVEPRLAQCAPTRDAAEAFGRQLAVTHLSGAEGFGAAPDGWRGDGFIGKAVLPMPERPLPRWGEFYSRHRVLPFARQAHHSGSLDDASLRLVEAVCERLESGEFDDGRPAARIHGDLWAGNVMFTPEGVVLVDPAAHGGHAETDLAMLHLFGAPLLERIQSSWLEAFDPEPGWRERIGLHQLHPVLVHAVLFGGGYGRQAGQIAADYA